jgi:PadR family transcriptional regulator, regulatory protein PadR
MAAADRDELRGRGRRGAGPGPGPGACGGPGGSPGGGRYRRSVLEVAILSSLADSTAHGYNLVDQIETLTGDLVCIDPGSMYRLLRALEEDGLVSSSWQTPEAGPSRRVYEISERGIEALEMMARSLSERAAAMQQLADHAVESIARWRASGS